MTKTNTIANARADIKKNRLNIAISGQATRRQLEKLYTEIRFCSADLQPGFEVISDISQCTVMYIDSLPVLNKIMNYLASQKPGEVVRVAHNKQISSRQLHAYTNSVLWYRSIDACSIAEAENKLVNFTKRTGIRFQLTNVTVDFKTENGKGHGTVKDISVSGCAVATESAINLSGGEHMTLSVHFDTTSDSAGNFETQAEVVWVNDASFAVRYAALDLNRQDDLYNLILAEVSRV